MHSVIQLSDRVAYVGGPISTMRSLGWEGITLAPILPRFGKSREFPRWMGFSEGTALLHRLDGALAASYFESLAVRQQLAC